MKQEIPRLRFTTWLLTWLSLNLCLSSSCGAETAKDGDWSSEGATNDRSYIDALPAVSQVKSLYQVLRGDTSGAKKTQENFSRQCPIVSQARYAMEKYVLDDQDAATETQMEFMGFVSAAANSVPVVGHIKGTIHYICGDKKGGDQAMKASSRSVGVIGGGVVGFAVGGPVGAAGGGVAGGLAVDGLTTGMESYLKDEYTPSGSINLATKIYQGEATAGDEFDLFAGTCLDAVVGRKSGNFFGPKFVSMVRSVIQDIRSGKVTCAAIGKAVLEFLKQAHETLSDAEVKEVLQGFQKAYHWVKTTDIEVFGQLKLFKTDILGTGIKAVIGRQNSENHRAWMVFDLLIQTIDADPTKFLDQDTWKKFLGLIVTVS